MRLVSSLVVKQAGGIVRTLCPGRDTDGRISSGFTYMSQTMAVWPGAIRTPQRFITRPVKVLRVWPDVRNKSLDPAKRLQLRVQCETLVLYPSTRPVPTRLHCVSWSIPASFVSTLGVVCMTILAALIKGS
jgi:hypothetical protein